MQINVAGMNSRQMNSRLCAIIIVQSKTLTCFFYQGKWPLQWQDCSKTWEMVL